jgi:hypothetical protein
MPVITPPRRNGATSSGLRNFPRDDFPRFRGTGFNRALIGVRAACKRLLRIARHYDCRVKGYVKVGRAYVGDAQRRRFTRARARG